MPSPKRITSAIYAAYTVVAAAFVVSSTYQIAKGVFSEPAAGAPAPAKVAVPPGCAEAVQKLALAVDRGVAAAAAATDRAEAEQRYRAGRSPEWDEAKRTELLQPCAAGGTGDDAVAALSRLDRAAEGAIRRQTDELGPVRRAVDSFIR